MNKFLSFTTALFVALSVNSEAKIWRVNNNVGVVTDFSTPNSAIAAATAGDTIHIEGSATSYGNLNVSKRLYVRGTGYFLNEATSNPKTQANKNAAQVSSIYMDAGSKGSVVEGLSAGSMYLSDTGVTVQRILCQYLYLSHGRNASYDTIRNNYITGGIYVNSSSYKGTGLMIYNNIIDGGINISAGVVNEYSGFAINNSFIGSFNFTCVNFIFQNNIFYTPSFNTYINSNIFVNNIASNTGIPTGNNNQQNVAMANVYEGWNAASGFSTDGKYKLKPGSPAIGAGTLNGGAVDCGAFGGPAPYILSGMPSMPSVYELTMPVQVTSGTPAVNISVSATTIH